MKKNKYLILTILWMIFIFVMSQTPGNDSSKQSNFIVDIIIHILPITRDTLSFIVRKCAHMTEYAILAFLLYKTFIHKQNPLIKSFIFTFLYACSDEFHQLFIAGRAGQFKDVCIDSTGALIMLLIIYFINKRKIYECHFIVNEIILNEKKQQFEFQLIEDERLWKYNNIIEARGNIVGKYYVPSNKKIVIDY